MKEIFEKIPKLIESKERSAFCTVVDTSGSTPQKPGSKLLILPDFRSLGTLGGGCVEAEVRKTAAGLMQSGKPKLMSFQLNQTYGWDDGLICGGTMRIFIDLPLEVTDALIYNRIQELIDSKIAVVVATVVEADENSPTKPGLKLMLAMNGEKIGSLGDSDLELEVTNAMMKGLEDGENNFYTSANGLVQLFIDSILPPQTLVIAGAGYIGNALCHLGKLLDFEVMVIDDRADLANKQMLPDATQIIVKDIATALSEFPITPSTYVVVVTRGHRHDEESLHAAINSSAAYIGMIGSKRKVKLIFDDLVELGVSEEKIKRVYAPIGLDIGSKTVQEIAISIAAQLVQVRHNRRAKEVVSLAEQRKVYV